MDIISTIDSATGCHQCGNPLGSSPSSDFCSEFCQTEWRARGSAGIGWLSMHRDTEVYPLPHFRWSPVVWEYLREGEGPPSPSPER